LRIIIIIIIFFQTVLEKPVSEVAKKVIPKIRFALFSPEELEKIEKENKKDNLIPVSNLQVSNIKWSSCCFIQTPHFVIPPIF